MDPSYTRRISKEQQEIAKVKAVLYSGKSHEQQAIEIMRMILQARQDGRAEMFFRMKEVGEK